MNVLVGKSEIMKLTFYAETIPVWRSIVCEHGRWIYECICLKVLRNTATNSLCRQGGNINLLGLLLTLKQSEKHGVNTNADGCFKGHPAALIDVSGQVTFRDLLLSQFCACMRSSFLFKCHALRKVNEHITFPKEDPISAKGRLKE